MSLPFLSLWKTCFHFYLGRLLKPYPSTRQLGTWGHSSQILTHKLGHWLWHQDHLIYHSYQWKVAILYWLWSLWSRADQDISPVQWYLEFKAHQVWSHWLAFTNPFCSPSLYHNSLGEWMILEPCSSQFQKWCQLVSLQEVLNLTLSGCFVSIIRWIAWWYTGQSRSECVPSMHIIGCSYCTLNLHGDTLDLKVYHSYAL